MIQKQISPLMTLIGKVIWSERKRFTIQHRQNGFDLPYKTNYQQPNTKISVTSVNQRG
jgi:hypothetical protein